MVEFSATFDGRTRALGFIKYTTILSRIQFPLAKCRDQHLAYPGQRASAGSLQPIQERAREQARESQADEQRRDPEPDSPAHIVLNPHQQRAGYYGADVLREVKEVEISSFL